MMVFAGAAAALGVCFCVCRAYAAGRRAERLKRVRKEVRAYEKMEEIRSRVDGLSVDGILNVLRAGGRKK